MSALAEPFPIVRERAPKLWTPRRVLVTPAAREWDHGRQMVDRVAALGAEIVELKSNRIPSAIFAATSPGPAYALAKTTAAITTAPPSKRRPRPIPPSADWQFHLAEGCPAHCQYCYLAGSLCGPPFTRIYANIPEILADLEPVLGQGAVTSRSKARASEGTTYECSCYTDPLALEHISSSLAAVIRFFGAWGSPVQLRWTTKFDAVEPLLALNHRRRTRVRFSVNASSVVRAWEGGTANLAARVQAMRKMALAGYPVGLTIAPIIAVPEWREEYTRLLTEVSAVIGVVPNLDLTVEVITHRFTPGSKDVLLQWYPRTTLEMDPAGRTRKLTKFGSGKYVYGRLQMAEMRAFFERTISDLLPAARILYWT